jgi:hypothetical protein
VKRGKVRGFSHGAARRMRESVQEVDRSKIQRMFFVTLTVPEGFFEWDGVEEARRRWVERFKRKWGRRAFAYWKKEPHKSGTPHLHLLVFWVEPPPDWKEFVAWNDAAWLEASGAPKALCNVKWLNGWGGVAHYVAKYMGKRIEEEEGVETGRCWGILNKGVRRRVVEVVEKPLKKEVGVRVLRVLRKLSERKMRRVEVTRYSLNVYEKAQKLGYLIGEGAGKLGGESKWRRVKFTRGMTFDGEPVEDLGHLLRIYQSWGFGVRVRKKRAGFNKVVKLFVQVRDVGVARKEKAYVECVGEEKEFVSWSTHFVAPGEVERLVAATEREVEDREKIRASLPF